MWDWLADVGVHDLSSFLCLQVFSKFSIVYSAIIFHWLKKYKNQNSTNEPKICILIGSVFATQDTNVTFLLQTKLFWTSLLLNLRAKKYTK